MGVKNGYSLLKGNGAIIKLSGLVGKTIAIDMMTYIIRFYKIQKTKTSAKRWYKEVNLFIDEMRKRDINCICVFDGNNKPPEKNVTITKRKANTANTINNSNTRINQELQMYHTGDMKTLSTIYPNKTPPEIFREIENLSKAHTAKSLFPSHEEIRLLAVMLEAFLDCDVRIADGEAESLCCYLLETGEADYVLSEDNDVMLYGAKAFIMKWNGSQGMLFNVDTIRRQLDLTRDEMICLCFILGTDYNPSGLQGYGYERGRKLIKTIGVEVVKTLIGVATYQRLQQLFTPLGLYTRYSYSDEDVIIAASMCLP